MGWPANEKAAEKHYIIKACSHWLLLGGGQDWVPSNC